MNDCTDVRLCDLSRFFFGLCFSGSLDTATTSVKGALINFISSQRRQKAETVWAYWLIQLSDRLSMHPVVCKSGPASSWNRMCRSHSRHRPWELEAVSVGGVMFSWDAFRVWQALFGLQTPDWMRLLMLRPEVWSRCDPEVCLLNWHRPSVRQNFTYTWSWSVYFSLLFHT